MAYDAFMLIEPAQVPASATAMFTNPAGKRSYIKQIFLYNTYTGEVVVEIHFVKNSGGSLGSPAAGNKFFKESMKPDQARIIDLGNPGWLLEDENDAIFMVAATASTINVAASGGQE